MGAGIQPNTERRKIMSNDHEFNYHLYFDGPQDHEYSVTVPKMYVDEISEPEIIIHVSAVGGGTVGNSYAGNWAYSVTIDGEETMHGDSLRTPTPHTHDQAARILADYLANPEEGETPMHDRLTLFANDVE